MTWIVYSSIIRNNELKKQLEESRSARDGITAMEVLTSMGSKASDEDWDQARLYAVEQYIDEGNASQAVKLYQACISTKEAAGLLDDYVAKLIADGDGIAAIELCTSLEMTADSESVKAARSLALWQYLDEGNAQEANLILQDYAWSGAEAAQNLFADTDWQWWLVSVAPQLSAMSFLPAGTETQA